MMMRKLSLLLIVLGIFIQVQAQTEDLGAIITLDWNNTDSRLALGYEGDDIIILNLEANIEIH